MPFEHGKDLVAVVLDRPYKSWNATETAGFSKEEAARLVATGGAHYPEANEAPAPAVIPGSGSPSGRSSCGRCGTFFPNGEEHVCPPGAPAAGPEVFEAGFSGETGGHRGRKNRRGR